MMNIDQKRVKRALKYTIIAALVVVLVELGGVAYLMMKWNLTFAEAIPDSGIFSAKGIVTSIGGWIFFSFWSYFLEVDK